MATYNEIPVGGATLGGVASRYVIYSITVSGGATGSGTQISTYNYTQMGIGGTSGGGVAFYQVVRTPTSLGGAVVGGTATLNIAREETAEGGALAGGDGIRTDPVSHYPNTADHDARIYIGEDSGGSFGSSFHYNAVGGLNVGGNSRFRRNAVPGISGVGISLGGEAGYQFAFTFDLDLSWRVRSRLTLDRTLLWDTGRLRQYFYRVIGKQKPNICDPLRVEDCCEFFVLNIHARTITDLCEKLRERRFRWPIETVERFSRPAENAALAEDEESGLDHNCNEVEPVDICSVPICSEFCIDADLVVNIGLATTEPQVNAFFSDIAEWDLPDGYSSIEMSGQAEVVFTPNVYSISYEPDDVELSIGGEAVVISPAYSYEGTGGLEAGSAVDVTASHWDYVGGNWPYQFAQDPTSASTIVAEPIGSETVNTWQLPNRILVNDASSSLVDVSYLASSDYLVAKNFEFNVPDNSRVGLIQVYVDRRSNSQVRDYEVYLIRGDEIISPNLASTSLWPNIDTVTVYQVIDDGFTSSVPGAPQQVGGWDVEDINDPEFGIVIRVRGVLNTTSVLAYVDAVRIVVYWEDDEEQILRVGGEAGVVSSAWNYTANGELNLSGSSVINSKKLIVTTSGGARIGGYNSWHYNYEVDAETAFVEISGEAITQPILGTGGAVLGGTASVASTQNFHTAEGGVELSFGEGQARTRTTYKKYNPVGGVTLGSNGSVLHNLSYAATGGVSTGGTPLVSSSVWRWVSDGNAIFIGGAAESDISNFDTVTDFGFKMDVIDIGFLFGTDVETNPLGVSGDTVTVCGCVDLPMTLTLAHNMVNRNKFSQFLARNNLVLPREIELHYNAVNELWQQNYHFKGYSADLDTLESWRLTFDIKCTSFVGGADIDKEVLAFSIQVVQKNLSTLEDYDTRIIIGFLPDLACSGDVLETSMVYDTQLDVATIKPDAQIYYYRLYDDLDLFKNDYWTKNSKLLIQISSVDLDQPQYRQNLDIVLNR